MSDNNTRSMIRRRTLLGAPLLLAGCEWRNSASYDGGWVGASHERGHRLQALSAGNPTSGSASGSPDSWAAMKGQASAPTYESRSSTIRSAEAASVLDRQGQPTNPAVTRRCSLAIVGGGVAGLAAARAAMAAGVDDLR